MDWKLIIAVIVAILIIFLIPQNTLSAEDVMQKADATPEAQFFKSLYPDATATMEEKACVERWFNEYVRDTSVPLVNRNKDVVCFEEEKDWVVTYSATGIVDTPGLSVGISSDGGDIIDAAFTSPYDDIYTLNYSFVTVITVLETILGKNDIVSKDGWAVFYLDDTKYSVYMIPYSDKTTALLYIEKTDGYGLPSTDNIRSDMDNAHEKFESGAKEFSSILRSGFVDGFNVTAYYLYFPSPQ